MLVPQEGPSFLWLGSASELSAAEAVDKYIPALRRTCDRPSLSASPQVELDGQESEPFWEAFEAGYYV